MIIETEQVPNQLRLPTYQNRLRIIGRQLDLGGYRSVNLLEIAGGFLVRVMRPGQRAPEALEFTHDDFPSLYSATIGARGKGPRFGSRHPMLPTGYEDFMRALGYGLDERHAEAIAITELDSMIAVNGVAPVETYHETTMAPFQILLRPDDVVSLLDQAFRRRTTDVPAPARVRLFGR